VFAAVSSLNILQKVCLARSLAPPCIWDIFEREMRKIEPTTLSLDERGKGEGGIEQLERLTFLW